jgi:hypothetical protein
MRKLAVLLALACALSSLGVLTAQQGLTTVPQVNADGQARTAVVYAVKDLAVWSEHGAKFDASILVAILKSRVIPGQWNGKDSIVPYPEKASLVISTTADAHKAIVELFAELNKNK